MILRSDPRVEFLQGNAQNRFIPNKGSASCPKDPVCDATGCFFLRMVFVGSFLEKNISCRSQNKVYVSFLNAALLFIPLLP